MGDEENGLASAAPCNPAASPWLSVLLHRDIELTSDSDGEIGSGELDKCFVNQMQKVWRKLDLTLIAL